MGQHGGGARRRGRAKRVLLATLVVMGATAFVPVVPAGSSATDDRAVDDATLEAGILMTTVPVALRPRCLVGDATDTGQFGTYGAAAAHVLATLTCRPDGLEVVYYDRFDGTEAMQAAFDAAVGIDSVSEDFYECPTRTEYERGGESAGVVACQIEGLDDGDRPDDIAPGTVILTWTYEPEDAIVWALAEDPSTVWSFFEDDGGPLSERSNRGIIAIPTHARLQAAGSRLLANLPKQARRTCEVVDDFTSDTLQTLYPWRLFVVADVEECRFRGGIEAEYVQFVSRAVLDRHFERFTPGDEPRVARYKTYSCPGTGSYRGGRWGCYLTQVDADAQPADEDYAVVYWTHDRSKVYAYGSAPVTNARRLLEWFVDEAGPNG